jgi:WD40 repeat protein
VFTGNGQFVATFSFAVLSTLRVFDAENGKEVRKADFGVQIHGMHELPRGTRYVVWTADKKAHVYEAGTGKVSHSWPWHPDSFLSWTPDGNILFLRPRQGEGYRALDVRSGKPAAGFEKILPYERIFPPILPSGEQAIVAGGGAATWSVSRRASACWKSPLERARSSRGAGATPIRVMPSKGLPMGDCVCGRSSPARR